nr:hypothetical protein [Mycoplasmopsis bovis]
MYVTFQNIASRDYDGYIMNYATDVTYIPSPKMLIKILYICRLLFIIKPKKF